MTMHPGYRLLWILWLTCVVALEVTDPGMESWAWIALFLWLVAQEAVGGLREGSGDTLSELKWSFAWGGWSRGVLVATSGVYYALRFYMLGGLPGVPYWAPRAVLATGLAVWLVVHLGWRGGHG